MKTCVVNYTKLFDYLNVIAISLSQSARKSTPHLPRVVRFTVDFLHKHPNWLFTPEIGTFHSFKKLHSTTNSHIPKYVHLLLVIWLLLMSLLHLAALYGLTWVLTWWAGTFRPWVWLLLSPGAARGSDLVRWWCTMPLHDVTPTATSYDTGYVNGNDQWVCEMCDKGNCLVLRGYLLTFVMIGCFV